MVLHHIFERLGHHHPDRNLPVIRRVVGIHRQGGGVESHLTVDVAAQLLL
jgi:hypothetical protein